MLTIGALLADPALELRLLEPGHPGALDAEIGWVHPTELPDPSPYLREHELVLTNGLWLETTAPPAFVAGVERAGAAGIVLGLRAELTRTPRALVEACRAVGMPLLEIAVEVPFTAVSRAAAARYAEQRQETLVGMVRRGDALAAAISHGGGATAVLAVLRRDHDLPLAVVDRTGRLLGASTAAGESAAPHGAAAHRGATPGGAASDGGALLDEDQLQVVAAQLARRPPPVEVDLGPAGPAALFPVGALGGADAALVCLRPAGALAPAERAALDQAARFLSLEVARQQAVQAIEQRFAGELLDMILSGASRAAEVPGRLRAFGVDPDGALAVCAVALVAPPPGPTATATAGAPADPALPDLAAVLTDFFLAESLPAAVAGGSRDVVVVLPWRHGEDGLGALATRLAAAVARRFPGRCPVVGLAAPVASAADLRQPLVQSREACRVLRARPGGPTVATFAELSTYRLLLAVADVERLRGFADTVLGPVRAHDRHRGGELEATLRAFLDHDGQWAPTAAALHVHVNTLRNRLMKITELTGRDVGRTADRVDLFLALEAG